MHDSAMITFVLSHACPLKCDFCCSSREVVGPGRIGRDTIEACLVRFGRERAVTRFAFTGGDPFLFLGDIEAALGAARGAGITQPFQIVTSAYWAKSPDQVRDILNRLKALGLDMIGLSFDREHARWVSPAQIAWVRDAAGELAIDVTLSGTFWDRADSIEGLWPELVRGPSMRVVNYPVALVGRARHQFRPKPAPGPVQEKLSCGRPGFYSLSIYPDGSVYPCCSGGFQIEGRLACGNIHTDSAARILYAALTKFHVRLVKEFGWGVLYEIVARDAPALLPRLPALESAGGVCEICRDLNLTLADALAPLYSTIETEYALTRAEFEWQHAGPGSPDDRAWCGDRHLSLPEFLDWLASERAVRLDYLAGVLQIGADRLPATLTEAVAAQ